MKLSNYCRIFKALSSEERLRIFLALYVECCSGNECMEMAFTKTCDQVKISRSTISHHFKELRNAGLISSERVGRTFRYKVNQSAVKLVEELWSIKSIPDI